MKLRMTFFFVATATLLAMSACNVNIQEGSGATGPNGMPLDSNTTIITHTEEHSESHTGFEVKGEINSESNTTVHTTVKAVKTLPLGQQVESWTAELFPDYKKVEMDPMDAYPKYKTAQETVFSRIRMINPISNDFGKAVYPRLLLKAYRFGSPAALTIEVEAWLNTLGSETQGIQLGQNVASVKSPPLLCAVIQDDFFVVQGGCVYEGKEWTATKDLFFQTMAAQGATYTWQVRCNGGELVYTTGGDI